MCHTVVVESSLSIELLILAVREGFFVVCIFGLIPDCQGPSGNVSDRQVNLTWPLAPSSEGLPGSRPSVLCTASTTSPVPLYKHSVPGCSNS